MHPLLRPVLSLCSNINNQLQEEVLWKRLSFLGHEVSARIDMNLAPREKLSKLQAYFFEGKAFEIAIPPSVDDYYLNQLLSRGRGSLALVSLVFRYFSDRLGLQVDLLNIPHQWIFRFSDDEGSTLFSLKNGLQSFTREELVSLCKNLRDFVSPVGDQHYLEPLTCDQQVLKYFQDLLGLARRGMEAQLLVRVYDQILEYFPSRMDFLSERAQLNFNLGRFQEALTDLKKYYVFCSPMKAPQEIRRIYDELTRAPLDSTM